MKTFTPDLDLTVLTWLRVYAALFAADFPQAKPARWAGVHLHGLLTDGDRKSAEPLSHRVALPAGLASKDPEQALQQFVSHSPWDNEGVLRHYQTHLAASRPGTSWVRSASISSGYLSIDNNLSERTLRAIAVGRNNWKFVGSASAGRRAAVHYTIAGTCRHLGLDPFAYPRDVLPALHALGGDPTPEQLRGLLPDARASKRPPTHPPAEPAVT